jgi:glycosyltransferase involved in cell wall biosynthesis
MSAQWNRILWVMNVAAIGGSTLWVLDAIRSLTLWQHDVVFFYGEEELSISERFREAGASIARVDSLTRATVDALDPPVVILSNADPKKLEGEHPWEWLTSTRTVISVHHSAVWPWIPGAAADVFVSHWLFNHYRGIVDRMRRAWVIPPGIHTADFADIPLRGSRRGAACVIGRHSTGQAFKYPPALLDILRRTGCRARIVGGRPFYGDGEQSLEFPEIGSIDTAAFLAGLDVFVYRSGGPETWCRAVTEAMAAGLPCVVQNRGGIAEQIEDGVDGFLCDADDEFVDRLRLLARRPALRERIGAAARLKAVRFFDVDRFREMTEQLMVRSALAR